jgi:hypothetical protein
MHMGSAYVHDTHTTLPGDDDVYMSSPLRTQSWATATATATSTAETMATATAEATGAVDVVSRRADML